LSVINQQNQWLSETSVKIHDLATQTNGRVTTLEGQVKTQEKALNIVRTVGTVIKSKLFWLALGIFFLIIYPFILDYRPIEIFKFLRSLL